MKALNVLPPDALTRVTEYVPQIVDYVQKIIDNGYAYESQGSVYFDTQAYQKDHFYGKLEPNSVGDAKLQADGEGALSILSDKRHPSDFALWKRSKEGEPTWDSKWGAGRPGWHIECSAMASDILGQQIDIHSGGEDLKFPHHDNELAQSEAYYNNKQWINYFIHSGHLHINGQKMAKSLKNFTTIQDALSKYSARQIRILFLMHKYDKTLSYSPESMQNAGEMEKTFTEFFHKVKSLIRENPINLPQFWTQDEKDLNEMLQKTKAVVHDALLDNFDTREVFLALAALVNNTNAYIAKKLQESNARVAVIQTIAEYITFIFNTFGLVDGQTTIGFGMEGGSSVEDSLKPILDALVKFRASVRSNAITKDTTAILKTCDELRDEILPLLGVRLDDKAASSNGGAVWKFENVETLKKEMELKKEIEANKLAKKLEQQKKEQEKFELSKVPPQQLFVQQKDKFSQFDDKGIPTHDATGKEISASQKKKLVKEYEEQNKNHQKYLATLEKTK
ncbi:cysteinyl-tRNA synthetase [Tieghemostelium lacteum]|uniref:cysteine--tRNA ligase n=1 Tax=Tieghemostelium lacteum TaxID=361077 RepID=A0A151Z718_TIELA|nr:cysteinyl-tRNA synthetase [Tieghemostelium lacteum]|eukprot:KYQ89756.1 cysteinyl-tRNA synthetase [Tieghemostelium lacteum]